jgi:hypothetical protein
MPHPAICWKRTFPAFDRRESHSRKGKYRTRIGRPSDEAPLDQRALCTLLRAPGGQCPIRVIRFVLSARGSLPVSPDERTFSDFDGCLKGANFGNARFAFNRDITATPIFHNLLMARCPVLQCGSCVASGRGRPPPLANYRQQRPHDHQRPSVRFCAGPRRKRATMQPTSYLPTRRLFGALSEPRPRLQSPA